MYGTPETDTSPWEGEIDTPPVDCCPTPRNQPASAAPPPRRFFAQRPTLRWEHLEDRLLAVARD